MGEGREAFAAGGDLKELNGLRAAEDVAAFFDFASNALDQIRNFPMPTVAALNGKALGGGAELALACDFRVAAAHASIGYIHATLNICCGFGGGADLMRALGASGGLLRGLYADTLDAHAALSLHLVDQVSSDGEPLADCVMRFLAPMLKQNVQVIRAYKAMAIAERQGLGMQQRRAIEREGFKGTWTSAAHWSAVESIERKRRERTG